MDHRHAPAPGAKYAHLEDEQRFVVASVPEGASAPRELEDRYLRGTRLRLRTVTDGATTIRKLGHKVPLEGRGPSAVLHTTCYLDESEFDVLAALPADVVRKRRWQLAGGAVDEFEGALRGLVLLEGPRPHHPAVPAVEVTEERAFTGGALARLDAAEARELVARARRLVP